MTEEAEIEADLEAAERRIGALLDVLAWLLRQMVEPRPIARRRDWPDAWLVEYPATRAAAMADPLLFDLARQQAAALLTGKVSPEPIQVIIVAPWAADLLLAERPAPGQGVSWGPGVRVLVAALWQELRDAPWQWGLPTKPIIAGDPWRGEVSAPTFAAALFNRLTQHPTLAGVTEEAIPSARWIRSLL